MKEIETKNKQYSFRFNADTMKKLDTLCDTYKRNRTQVIEMLITGEYFKATEIGKAKLTKIMTGFDNLAKSFEEIKQ